MGPTVDAQVPLTSSSVGIGEAARRVGMAPSAIRFYEEQGLVDAPRGTDGRRRFGQEELRTLAFVAVGRELGFGVATIRAAVRPAPGGWTSAIDDQIADLDATIARAQRAREALVQARECPAPEPVRDCPHLHAALDELLRAGPGGGKPPVRTGSWRSCRPG